MYHTVKAKGILSAHNGMNLYRGCAHGCIYCDSRSHCYHMAHDFEDIEVKENAIELLDDALRRKRQKAMIGTGAMSDPYQPIERTMQLTHRALEVIERRGFGVALQTKSADVLRDLDLLKRINQKTKAVVQMTLTTWDEALCKKVEPNVSTTRERLEALQILHREGIPTVVWLTPILPFLNDAERNIRHIVTACAEVGVRGIISFGMGLTLREGDREYFYQQLDRLFPGLKQRYIDAYGLDYECPSPNAAQLHRVFDELCAHDGLISNDGQLFAYLHEFEEKRAVKQLSLFDPPDA